MTSRRERLTRPPNDRGDEGAIVILALFLVVTVGLIAGSLATLAATSLNTTRSLQQTRSVEFSSDAAVEAAVQELRFQAPSSPLTCPNFPAAANTTITINAVSVVVECSMGILPSFYGRIVQFDACLATNGAPSPSLSTCQANAVTQATVVYNDEKPGCTNGAVSGCYGSYWGQGGVTVESWNQIHANG